MASKTELHKRLAARKAAVAKKAVTAKSVLPLFFVTLPPMSKPVLDALEDSARAVMGDAGRFVDSYPLVQNPRAQWACNLRVTADVTIRLGNGKRVTVNLKDYWPCWKWAEDGSQRRDFIKHDYRKVVKSAASGNLKNPLQNCLEWLAYAATMVVKAREAAPREGHICGNVARLLGVAGHVVESVKIDGVEYTSDTVESKIDRLNRYVEAGISTGQYTPQRGKRDSDLTGEAYG